MVSFIPVLAHSDFSFSNLPWAAVRWSDGSIHLATRIGDRVLSLKALRAAGKLASWPELDLETFNRFIDRGPEAWSAVRAELIEAYREGSRWEHDSKRALCECDWKDAPAVLPVTIGDYSDF